MLRAIQEGHDLGAGAGHVGAERRLRGADGDAVLHSPGHGLSVIGIRRNVAIGAQRLGLGGAGGVPQEGDDLPAGAALLGGKAAVADAACDALLGRPLDGVIVIGRGRNVREALGRSFLGEAGLDADLAVRHGEGVLAVLVRHSQVLQRIALFLFMNLLLQILDLSFEVFLFLSVIFAHHGEEFTIHPTGYIVLVMWMKRWSISPIWQAMLVFIHPCNL